MERLSAAGICYRRLLNITTEANYPHSAYNFRVGWESNGAPAFEVWDGETCYEIVTPIRAIKRDADLAEETLLTLEDAVKHFEKLKDEPSPGFINTDRLIQTNAAGELQPPPNNPK